jgi:streptomycin 6-kinase
VAGLPGLIESTLQRWHLTPDGEPCTGMTALVVPVRDADEVRRAVKFSFVEDDNAGEIPTLRLWAGRGAATLLRADPPRGVLLLGGGHSGQVRTVDLDAVASAIASDWPSTKWCATAN